MSPTVEPPRLAYQPALDGLRGVAVAGVVCYHAALLDDVAGLERWTRGGYLGVSAFFTLSGFLIASLLVLEHDATGRLAFGRFWSRRFRRLLPALLLTVIAVGVLAPLVGADAALESLRSELVASAGYVLNWQSILSKSDYAATFATAQSPLKHLWSVSIEEQWYLLLPVIVAVVLGARRHSRRTLTAVFAVLAALSVAATVWVGGGHYANRAYLGTDTRLAEMAVGALLAVWTAGRLGPALAAGRSAWLRWSLDLSTFAVLVAGVVVWTTVDIHSDVLYRGGLALHAVGVAVVIFAAMHDGTLVNRLLRFRPLAALGKVSYGVYLFHWPVLLWLTPGRLHVSPAVAPAVQVTVTLAIAAVSYRFYEAPIRHGALVRAWRRPALPAVGFATVALIAVTLPRPDTSRLTALDAIDTADVSNIAHSNRLVEAGTSTTVAPGPGVTGPGSTGPGVTTTAPAPPPPPVRVLVIGDSFALSLVPGLSDAARSRGDFSLLTGAMVGCGFGRGGRNRGIGLDVAYSKECRQRDEWIVKALAFFRPDVVVAAGGMWDVTNRKPPGFTRWTHIGDPAYDLYLSGEIRHVADLVQSGGAHLVWLDAPHWRPVYTPANFMGRGPYPEADPARADRFNQVLEAALAGRPKTQILDIAGFLRSQPGGEFAPDIRADGVHLTRASTQVVASWLVPQLIAVARDANGG